jgi:hypothetical protein
MYVLISSYLLSATCCSFCTIGVVLSTASVVCWAEFLAADLEVPDSIPDATRFSDE